MSAPDLTGAQWKKSNRSSQNGQCALCAALPDGSVAMKDSKLGDESPVLIFTRDEWLAFLDGAKAGEFDL